MANNDFQKVLAKITNKYNLKRQFDSAMICHKFRQIIEGSAPKLETNQYQVISHHDGVIKVNVRDSLIAQELNMQKFDLLEEMNQIISPMQIRDLKIVIGALKN